MYDWLLLLVKDGVVQSSDRVLIERRLQRGHRIQGDAHRPDITPLVEALVLDHLWGQAERRADNPIRFDVALVVQNS